MVTQALRSIAGLMLCACFFLATSSVTRAAESSPAFDFYKTYLEQTAAAKEMKDIGVFMPAWWNERQQSASSADQAAAVERVRKSSAALSKVALEREEPVNEGVRLHMTATTDDLPVSGSVLLIKESGAFKVEESIWRSAEPIVN